jgi:hypothetical protein
MRVQRDIQLSTVYDLHDIALLIVRCNATAIVTFYINNVDARYSLECHVAMLHTLLLLQALVVLGATLIQHQYTHCK